MPEAEPLRQRYLLDLQPGMRNLQKLKQEVRQTGQTSQQQFGGMRREGGLLERNFAGIASSAKRFLGGILLTVLTAIAAAMVRGTKQAIDFSKRVAEIGTLGDGSAIALRRLERGIIDIAARVGGGSFQEFAKALYDIQSAGFTGADGLHVLEVSAKSAIGGVTDVARAADLVTSVLNAYGLSAEDAAHVSDLLFTTVKQGKTTIDQLAGAIGQVAPAAAAAKVPLEEVLAAVATLTASGLSTAEAVTRVRGVIQAIVKPTDEAADMAKSLGIELNASALASKGLSGVLKDVERATGGSAEKLSILFNATEAYEGAVQLAGKQSQTFARNLDGMAKSAGAATEAYQKMRDETANLAERLRNKLDGILIKLGEKTLPAFNAVLRVTLRLMETFDTPAERLLGILRDLEGVDPRIVAQLQIQVDRQELLKVRQEALDTLADHRQLEMVGRDMAEAILRGAAIDANEFIKVDVSKLDISGLEALQSQIIGQLQELESRVQEEAGFLDRINVNRLVNLYQRQLEAITAVVVARQQLTSSNEALLTTEKELATLRAQGTGTTPVGPGGFSTKLDLNLPPRTPGTTTGGGLTGAEKKKLEQAREDFKELAEAAATAAVASAKHAGLIETLIEHQDRLNELKKIEAALGKEANVTIAGQTRTVTELIEAQEEKVRIAEEDLRRQKDLEAATGRVAQGIQKIKPLGLAVLGDDPAALTAEVNNALSTFEDKITSLRNKLATGQITKQMFSEQANALAQRFVAHMTAIEKKATNLSGPLGIMLRRSLEEAFEAGTDAALTLEERAEMLAQRLERIATGLDSLSRLAGIFGESADGLDRLISSTAQFVRGLGEIKRVQAQIASGELTGTAALFGKINAGLAVMTPALAVAIELVPELGESFNEAAAIAKGALDKIGEGINEVIKQIQSAEDKAAGFIDKLVGDDGGKSFGRGFINFLKGAVQPLERIQQLGRWLGLGGKSESEKLIDDFEEDFEQAMREIQARAKIMGRDFDATAATIDLLQNTLVQMSAAGLEASDMFKRLEMQLRELEAAAGDAGRAVGDVRGSTTGRGRGDDGRGGTVERPEPVARTLKEILDEIEQQINAQRIIAQAKGEPFDEQAARSRMLAQAIEDYVEAGGRNKAVLDALSAAYMENLHAVSAATGTIEGALSNAVSAISLFTDVLGLEAPEALDRFITMFLENAGAIPTVLGRLLAEARGLDLSTDEGQQRLREIITVLTETLLAGGAASLGLTDDQLRQLITSLDGLADQVASGGDSRSSRSVAYLRTITEFQGNELVLSNIEIAFWARRSAEGIDRLVDLLGGVRERPANEPGGMSVMENGRLAGGITDSARVISPDVEQLLASAYYRLVDQGPGTPGRQATSGEMPPGDIVHNWYISITTEQRMQTMLREFERQVRKKVQTTKGGDPFF